MASKTKTPDQSAKEGKKKTSQWNPQTCIRVTKSGNLSLNHSCAELAQAFRSAEWHLKMFVIFDGAFEDASTTGKFPFLRDTLVIGAKDAGYNSISKRIQQDNHYANVLVDAVSRQLLLN
jgi:hypothetical protein